MEQQEPVEQWRMRVIYSMLGQMAYASLWDVEENEQPVSVVHFKSRMKKLIESYCDIFNDLHKSFGYNYEICWRKFIRFNLMVGRSIIRHTDWLRPNILVRVQSKFCLQEEWLPEKNDLLVGREHIYFHRKSNP